MNRASTTLYCTERRIFFALLTLLCILAGLYMYLLSASVVQVVARKAVDQEIAHLQSQIGDLESAYIAADHAITEEMLTAYGFVSGAHVEKTFVQRAPETPVLVVHDES